MLHIAKLIPLFCLALLIQLMPFSATQAIAAGTKKLNVKVNKNYFLIKPGQTATVDINVDKLDATDNIELKVKTSPLQISTTEDSLNTSSMIHHATMQITAPANSEMKSYTVILTASNGKGKSKKSKLTVNVGEETPGPDFNITSAAYGSPESQDGGPAVFYLTGTGFGQTPRVIVNGFEVTATIVSVTDNMIEMRAASKEAFNFNDDESEILVDVNGRVANRFILDFDLTNNQ